MITNGIILIERLNGGCYDDMCNPIAAKLSWGHAINALIVQNGVGKIMKYDDGQYVIASYKITIEGSCLIADCSKIRLINNKGRTLGEFQVIEQNIQYLELVNRTSITV